MPVDPLRERRLIRTVRTAVMLAGMVALCSALACGGGGGGTDDEAPAVSRAPVANPVDQATAGSITGT